MSSALQLPEGLIEQLATVVSQQQKVVVLSGAGISAESGIPTFRGQDGYWVAESRNYMPEEIATNKMFSKQPATVWAWYLYRFGTCRNASPNPGHYAIAKLEKLLGDQFHLITQNVDGLHLEAGSSLQRTFQIHGNVHYVRCHAECDSEVYALQDKIDPDSLQMPTLKEAGLSRGMQDQLRCSKCDSWLRPQILWFDEFYDELNYRADSAMKAARQAEMLIVVGTAGATNLPSQIGYLAVNNGALLVDINLEENMFSKLATSHGGYSLIGPSASWLPVIVDAIQQLCD